MSLSLLETPRDGVGRPLPVPELPALHRPVPIEEPELIPSAPATFGPRPPRRPIVVEPDQSPPAETPRPNDSRPGESVGRRSPVSAAPASDRAAASRPIPSLPRKSRRRRPVRDPVEEVAAMVLDALDQSTGCSDKRRKG